MQSLNCMLVPLACIRHYVHLRNNILQQANYCSKNSCNCKRKFKFQKLYFIFSKSKQYFPSEQCFKYNFISL
jgi:hypothetical protein